MKNNLPEKVKTSLNKNELNSNESKSRGEKRTRKALEIFSYKKFGGITKTLFQKSANAIFVIDQPDVYKNSSNNSFLIFGETSLDTKFIGIQKNAINN